MSSAEGMAGGEYIDWVWENTASLASLKLKIYCMNMIE